MKTIYLPAGTEYVCVAELLRCVYQTGRDGVYEVYESDAGKLELRMKGCAPSKNEMKTQFNAFCKREGIEPTSQIDRWEKNYTGEGLQDGVYEVTVTEAERFAAPFRVSFQVEGQVQTAATPAPVLVETTEQRRARWLDWYGKGERGAVQRVYEREPLLNPKADRSFIGKEIDKAKSEKAETKRGGAMFGQLVQGGKRMG